jgi:putative transposase
VLDAWAHEHGVRLQFIRPGKPMENAHIEGFNGRLREECVNQHAFVSIDDARKRIEAWRIGNAPKNSWLSEVEFSIEERFYK